MSRHDRPQFGRVNSQLICAYHFVPGCELSDEGRRLMLEWVVKAFEVDVNSIGQEAVALGRTFDEQLVVYGMALNER